MSWDLSFAGCGSCCGCWSQVSPPVWMLLLNKEHKITVLQWPKNCCLLAKNSQDTEEPWVCETAGVGSVPGAAEGEQSVSVPAQTHWSNPTGDGQVQHSFYACCLSPAFPGSCFALFGSQSTFLGGKIEQQYMCEITRMSRGRNVFECPAMESLPFRGWFASTSICLDKRGLCHYINTTECPTTPEDVSIKLDTEDSWKCLDLSGSLAMPPKPPGHFTAVLQKEYFRT